MSFLFKATARMKPVFDKLYQWTLFVCKCLLAVDILIVTMQVSGRFVWFIPDPSWTEEIILLVMTYMGLISAALALRANRHIRMTVFDRILPEKALICLDILADLAITGFAVIMIAVGWQYAVGLGAKGYFTSLPNLSKFWLFFPVPLAGCFAVLCEIELMLNHLKGLFTKTAIQQPDAHDESFSKEAIRK